MKNSTIQYQMDSLSVELEADFFPLIEKGSFLEKIEKGIQI